MSKVAIKGADTGTGVFTLESPATNTDRTLVLPDEAGTVDLLQRSGNVLQVVQSSFSTSTNTTSTNWTATGLAATITPSSTSSKIMVVVSCPVFTNTAGSYSARYTVFRGTTAGINLGDSQAGFLNLGVFLPASPYTGQYVTSSCAINYVDSPSTTSAQTYTFAAKSEGNSSEAGVCSGGGKGTITLVEIAG